MLVENQTLRVATALFVCTVVTAAGCNRQYYREQADRDVSYLISQKSDDPRWGLPGFNVEVDSRSRYYDPYDPDRPPMPQDDPASHQFMHCVNGMKGWPNWHRDGERSDIENPSWRDQLGEYIPLNENGEVVLTLESALRMAYVNSPTYQQQIETLYLSALDVSTERFRLQTQFFGGNDTQFAHLGRLRPGGESNTLSTDTDLSFTRRFATAGQLLVGFANSFVWQFAGPDTNATTSLINFNLVQPLLRGAGRDIALEQLTIVERGLLANLRAMTHYRQGFFTNVAIGELGVSGPSRRGGFFGGTGLTGFTGQGAGGLGGVGAATGFGRGGFFGGGAGGAAGGAGFAGGGAGTVGGFIGQLQQLQQIRNTQVSLESQLRTLSLLEANLDAGIIDLTQVDQFRQNIETERANLLQAENDLKSSIENYVTGTLGLPPDLPVTLDDSMIRQFQFIDARMTNLQDLIADFQDDLGNFPNLPERAAVANSLEMARGLTQQAQEQLQRSDGDVQVLQQQSAVRETNMTEAERSLYARDRQRLVTALADLNDRLSTMEPRRAQMVENLNDTNARQITDQLVVWSRELLTMVQEVSLVQARARLESVVVEPIVLDAEEAFRIAWANRLDVMNNRAALVDSWRLIQFNADALQSNLDVVFSGDVRTVGNNPVKFRGPNGSLRVGLEFDAPFTRLLERNNFRQSLIDYQQDRRQFIQFRDRIHSGLRQLLRQIEQLRVNLEIQRRAVVIAIRRVDLTREELNRPTAPPEPGAPITALGPTAATNLLTALSDLRNTQNNFMSVWLNYYANRMRLLRELGLMVLDEDGNWIDAPIPESLADAQSCDDFHEPPPVPQEWVEQALSAPPTATDVNPKGSAGPRGAPVEKPHGGEIHVISHHRRELAAVDDTQRPYRLAPVDFK